MTRTAGALLILYGFTGWIAGIHDYDTALTSIANGLGFIGLKRAQEKAVDVVVETTNAQTETLTDIVKKHQR